MKNIISWLQGVEQLAEEVYLRGGEVFSSDYNLSTFLTHLAAEEAWHSHIMGIAAKFLDSEPGTTSAISIDAETGDRVVNYFVEMRKGLEAKTLSKSELLEKIVEAELSEWNDIFIYAVNTLKIKSAEFKYPAARIQAHLKEIEHYLRNVEKQPEILEKISRLPPIWVESILVVDDEPMVAELIKSLLNRDGKIDTVENGRDALELVQKNYYKLIISDIDMPLMNGLTFFDKAVNLYPNISSRFLFITGDLSLERKLFFEMNKINYLKKPMEIKKLRSMARNTILSN